MSKFRTIPIALAALLAWLASAGVATVEATEFGASHVVFEKATKMKKVETSLLMSVLDQSQKGDALGKGRRLRCSIAAVGKGGVLPVKGNVILRLEGRTGASEPWQGSTLVEALDPRGDVLFEADAIAGLVDEALASEAEPALFRIDFDGGKGKKVSQVTVDCIHESSE